MTDKSTEYDDLLIHIILFAKGKYHREHFEDYEALRTIVGKYLLIGKEYITTENMMRICLKVVEIHCKHIKLSEIFMDCFKEFGHNRTAITRYDVIEQCLRQMRWLKVSEFKWIEPDPTVYKLYVNDES